MVFVDFKWETIEFLSTSASTRFSTLNKINGVDFSEQLVWAFSTTKTGKNVHKHKNGLLKVTGSFEVCFRKLKTTETRPTFDKNRDVFKSS